MPRRLKSALELVTDIGAKAFDLQHHSPLEVQHAFAIHLGMGNGAMFDWLLAVLEKATALDAVARSDGDQWQ